MTPTFAALARHLDEPFEFSVLDGMVITVVLESAVASRPAPCVDSAGALVFRGPTDRTLGQGLVNVSHPALGDFVLFVVPVGRDDSAVRYEAVFG